MNNSIRNILSKLSKFRNTLNRPKMYYQQPCACMKDLMKFLKAA